MSLNKIACFAVPLLAGSFVRAADIHWDADDAAGLQGGNAVWDAGTSSNWNPDATGLLQRVPWTSSSDNAWFDGGASTVTVSGAVIAEGLFATVPDVSFAGTGTLGLGSGGLSFANYAPFAPALTLLADQTWSLTSAGYLDASGLVTLASSRLTVDGEGVTRLALVSGTSGGITMIGRGNLVLSGPVGFAGDLWLRKGTTTLLKPGGATNFTGNLLVDRGGTLRLSGPNQFGTAGNPGAVVSFSNGLARLDGSNAASRADNQFRVLTLQTSLVDVVWSDLRLGPGPVTARPTQFFNVLRAQDTASRFVLTTNVLVDCVAGGTTLTMFVQGPIDEQGGAFSLTKAGGGSLRLDGPGTFSGGLVISNGSVQILMGHEAGTNTVRLAGGTLDVSTAGLWESELAGFHNTNAAGNPVRVQLGTPKANVNDAIAFRTNTTWLYEGRMRLTNAVTWTFGEGFDESVLVRIDGTNVLEDLVATNPTRAQVSFAAGFHTLEIRLGQSTGAVGPCLVNGWNLLGLGVDQQGRNLQAGTNFTAILDPGDGTWLDRGTVRFSNAVQVLAPSGFRATGRGTVECPGAFQIDADLVVTTDADAVWSGPISGAGALAKTGAGSLRLTGPRAGTNTTTLLAGGLDVRGVHGANAGYLIQGGTLSGTGALGGPVRAFAGIVAPGVASGGTLTVSAFTQALGTLQFTLAGANPAQFGRLAVTGAAQLGGTLAVGLTNGFAPASGQTFPLLTAASITGGFTTTNLPALGTGLTWSVEQSATAVVARVLGGLSGYDGFVAQIANPAQRSYADDPDGDGFANLLEYATGGNPTNADAVATLDAVRTNGVLALRFSRSPASAGDATLFVEGALAIVDGGLWTVIATNAGGLWTGPASVVESGGDPRAVVVEDTQPAATNRFLRLRVTRP